MSARIYSAPEELGDPPAGGGDIEEWLKAEREWEATVVEWCKANGKGALRGTEYRYPMGDGAARYVVYTERPLALIHLATGDRWDIPEVVRKGLDLAEIRAHVKQREALASIFGSRRIPPIGGPS